MANYIVSNTTFTPYTYEELIKPYENYLKEYAETEAGLASLAEQAAAAGGFTNEYLGEKAQNTYTKYNEALNALANDFYQQGYSSAVKRRAIQSKADYKSQIEPIINADTAIKELIAEQRKGNPKGDIQYTRDASKLTISDYLKEPTFTYESRSLSEIEKEGFEQAAALSNRLINAPILTLAGTYYKIAKGVNQETADAWLKGQNNSNKIISYINDIETLVENSHINSGMYSDEQNAIAKDRLRSGIFKGLGYDIDYMGRPRIDPDGGGSKEDKVPEVGLTIVEPGNVDLTEIPEVIQDNEGNYTTSEILKLRQEFNALEKPKIDTNNDTYINTPLGAFDAVEYNRKERQLKEKEQHFKEQYAPYKYLNDGTPEGKRRQYEIGRALMIAKKHIQNYSESYNVDNNTYNKVRAGIANTLKNFNKSAVNNKKAPLKNSEGDPISWKKLKTIMEDESTYSIKIHPSKGLVLTSGTGKSREEYTFNEIPAIKQFNDNYLNSIKFLSEFEGKNMSKTITENEWDSIQKSGKLPENKIHLVGTQFKGVIIKTSSGDYVKMLLLPREGQYEVVAQNSIINYLENMNSVTSALSTKMAQKALENLPTLFAVK